jgi:hypothetical protein
MPGTVAAFLDPRGAITQWSVTIGGLVHPYAVVVRLVMGDDQVPAWRAGGVSRISVTLADWFVGRRPWLLMLVVFLLSISRYCHEETHGAH